MLLVPLYPQYHHLSSVRIKIKTQSSAGHHNPGWWCSNQNKKAIDWCFMLQQNLPSTISEPLKYLSVTQIGRQNVVKEERYSIWAYHEMCLSRLSFLLEVGGWREDKNLKLDHATDSVFCFTTLVYFTFWFFYFAGKCNAFRKYFRFFRQQYFLLKYLIWNSVTFCVKLMQVMI